jgi:putative nucleotidyltransferase with HDIG domain
MVALPPFPTVAIKALKLMSRKDSRLRELHDLIRADQAFSGEILRLVNSPLFPFRIPITSTLQAVMLLGFERVQSLAVVIGIRAYLRDSLDIPALRSCWRHSLACAIVAEQLASLVMLDKDALFTAGIMHDLGRLALAVCHREGYAGLVQNAQELPCDVLARERQLFGIDHCEAGSALVHAWNLPPEFAEITAHHHETPSGVRLNPLAIVQFSCGFADALGFPAIPSLKLYSYEQLRSEIPADIRQRFPEDPSALRSGIDTAMNLMECR